MAIAGAAPRLHAASEAPKEVAVLTFVNGSAGESERKWRDALLKSFAAHGYRQGENLRLRWYEVQVQSPWDTTVPNAIARLMASRPDCIVTVGDQITEYLKGRIGTTPVVADLGDPVGFGVASSLLRPGGNFTGLHSGDEEVAAKEIEILKDIVPGLRCVAFIGFRPQLSSLPVFERAAKQAGLYIRTLVPPVPSNPEFLPFMRSQFASLRGDGCLAGHLQTSVSSFIDTACTLALEHGIALAYAGAASFEREGILMHYAIERLEGLRSAQRIPAIVARILRGERPGDIAFEGPTGYRLALNLKTAARLGLSIPPSVLILASEVHR